MSHKPVCFTGKLQLIILQGTRALCSTKRINPPSSLFLALKFWGFRGSDGPYRPLSLTRECKLTQSQWKFGKLVILRKHLICPKSELLVITPGDQSSSPAFAHDLLSHVHSAVLSTATWPGLCYFTGRIKPEMGYSWKHTLS